MVYLSWLLVVVMAYVCVPGFGSVCWDKSHCNDLSSKGRLQDCIRLCVSTIQSDFPQLGALALKVNHNDDNLLLSIILASMVSDNKISETDLKAHSDERRSYSMEHFRWGKPSGRKRRPVKVFASSLEGGGSSERSFIPQARRQRGSNRDEVRELKAGSQNQGSQMVNLMSHVPVSLQERKNGAYQMNHFRWGSPPASKRNGSLMKQRKKKPKGKLDKLLRNIIVKDVQRIMG
ncbi:pro-opiomelanocortin-like [Anoplopoma fimbria]|uniref:pro-opiomelanocortin-like n=1 Tax=Anoplopoma fimbria TaxID=229290 RepID=UPI0023EC8427|nr:pro-opiomelanocortin-like [Anoplopoma fimbria]